MEEPFIYHVSDRADIRRFEPRPPPSPSSGVKEEVVWAIGARLLHNYLVPRDCPRVGFYAGPDTSSADRERFLGPTGATYILAIEKAWFAAVSQSTLYLYRLPTEVFARLNNGAEYYVAHQAVTPLEVHPVDDLVSALLTRDVELRLTPSLWPLHHAVVNSSLAFSGIRLRNAAVPPQDRDIARFYLDKK